MRNLFNMDNPVFVFMGRVGDLMILNLLCMVFCLPIITAGPAITAMYYVTLKLVRKEDPYIVRSFFHSFKENLKQGVLITLIMFLVGGLLVWDYFFFQEQIPVRNTFISIWIALCRGAGFFFVMVFLYIWPILAQFYNSTKMVFKNAFFMSIHNLGKTILIALTTAAPILLMLLGYQKLTSYVVLFYVLMGFAVIALCNSVFFVKIFDRYIPKPEDEEKHTDSDSSDVEIDTSVFHNLKPTSIEEEADDTTTIE